MNVYWQTDFWFSMHNHKISMHINIILNALGPCADQNKRFEKYENEYPWNKENGRIFKNIFLDNTQNFYCIIIFNKLINMSYFLETKHFYNEARPFSTIFF